MPNQNDKVLVDMWNQGKSKSSIIIALYDTGLTISEVLAIFQRYGVKMIYNHCYNVISKKYGEVRTSKKMSERTKLEVK